MRLTAELKCSKIMCKVMSSLSSLVRGSPLREQAAAEPCSGSPAQDPAHCVGTCWSG